MGFFFNPIPDDKSLDVIKLKACADDKINFAQMMSSVFNSVENIVVTSIFSFSLNVFKRVLSWVR